MVVGDQGALGRGADLPVEPDHRVEGEQALDDAGPQPRGDAAAVTVQAELVLEGPGDRLHPLAEPGGGGTRDGEGPRPGGYRAAVTVQAELVLEGPDDRLHPLAQPGGEATWIGLVGTGGAQQDQLLAGQGGLDLVAGK